jgi:hypothetical protein
MDKQPSYLRGLSSSDLSGPIRPIFPVHSAAQSRPIFLLSYDLLSKRRRS